MVRFLFTRGLLTSARINRCLWTSTFAM